MPSNQHGVQYKLWKVVTNTIFEWFIMGLIVANTIVLMLKVKEFCEREKLKLILTIPYKENKSN